MAYMNDSHDGLRMVNGVDHPIDLLLPIENLAQSVILWGQGTARWIFAETQDQALKSVEPSTGLLNVYGVDELIKPI